MRTGIRRLLILLFVSAIAVPWLYFEGPPHSVSVEGTVVDASGREVSGARVVVLVWSRGFWDSFPAWCKMTTDDRGRFSLEARTNFPFRTIQVEAARPGLYGSAESMGGDVRVHLTHRESTEAEPWFDYDQFAGRWVSTVNPHLFLPDRSTGLDAASCRGDWDSVLRAD